MRFATLWSDWCLIQEGTEILVRRLIVFLLAGILALVLMALPDNAAAQSGSFEIAQHGQAVGTASFQFTATKDGYDSTSLVKVAMQGLDYALSKTEQLNPANQLKHVLLSATVNGEAVNVVAAPDAAQFLLNISASGKSSTTRLAAHPGAVFLADFDPGALETLLALAVTQNNRDLWAILPKEAGSIEPVQLATYRRSGGNARRQADYGAPPGGHHRRGQHGPVFRTGEPTAAGRVAAGGVCADPQGLCTEAAGQADRRRWME